MFTGIIEELGTVVAFDGRRADVSAGRVAEDATVDDSIAVNGVCLTVVACEAGVLSFDVSAETLARTSLDRVARGSKVNLERPLTLATRLGGHIVQGHVDGVGTVMAVRPGSVGATIQIEAPAGLGRYMVEKGSITVDGVSLTIAKRTSAGFEVALIPHTLAVTTLGSAQPGDRVNLEVDIIAKYVEAATNQNGERT